MPWAMTSWVSNSTCCRRSSRTAQWSVRPVIVRPNRVSQRMTLFRFEHVSNGSAEPTAAAAPELAWRLEAQCLDCRQQEPTRAVVGCQGIASDRSRATQIHAATRTPPLRGAHWLEGEEHERSSLDSFNPVRPNQSEG